MKTSQHFIVLATALGLLVTASIVLALYVWQTKTIARTGSLTKKFEPQSLTSQKDMIATYLEASLALHTSFTSGKISKSDYKSKALALVVPAVLRERHLQWILAIDAGRDAVIEDMMQEYSVLSLVK